MPLFSYLKFWGGILQFHKNLETHRPNFEKVLRPKNLPNLQSYIHFHTPFIYYLKFWGVTLQFHRNLETHGPIFEKSSDQKSFRTYNPTSIFTRPLFTS